MAVLGRRIPSLAHHSPLVTKTLGPTAPLEGVTDPGVTARLLAHVTSTLDAAQGSWDIATLRESPGASPQGHHSQCNNEARLDHSLMAVPSGRPHHWPLRAPPDWRRVGDKHGASLDKQGVSGFFPREGLGMLPLHSGQGSGSRGFVSGQGSVAAPTGEPYPEGLEEHRETLRDAHQSTDSVRTGVRGDRVRRSSSMGVAASLPQQSTESLLREGWREEGGNKGHLEEGGQGQRVPGESKVVLYRGKGMRLLRILVRFKVAQLAAVGATAVPIAAWTQGGHVSVLDVAAIAAVVGGAAAASAALWYYSSRYIGELALVPPRSVVISTLDFWGNREDKTFDVREVVPPLQGLSERELTQMAKHVFVPVDVVGNHQYVLSLRHGRILDKARLHFLLTGVALKRDGGN